MNNKRGPNKERTSDGGNYAGKYTICEGQCDDERTNVHSGFTRHMTAAAATLRITTPSAVEYRATYCEPDLVLERECRTAFDLQCLWEARQVQS